MYVKELKCPRCGASVSRDKSVCGYCKAQYIIEERAVLFGEYGECTTFRELLALRNRTRSWSLHAQRLLEACKFCGIKNCEYFNKDSHEIFPEKSRALMKREELDEFSRQSFAGTLEKDREKMRKNKEK